MASVIVDGTEYEIPSRITFLYARVIKRVAGVRGAEIQEAIEAGDTDVLLALAALAIADREPGSQAEKAKRAEEIAGDLLGREISELVFVGDETEEDEQPPADPTSAPTGSGGETTNADEPKPGRLVSAS